MSARSIKGATMASRATLICRRRGGCAVNKGELEWIPIELLRFISSQVARRETLLLSLSLLGLRPWGLGRGKANNFKEIIGTVD